MQDLYQVHIMLGVKTALHTVPSCRSSATATRTLGHLRGRVEDASIKQGDWCIREQLGVVPSRLSQF